MIPSVIGAIEPKIKPTRKIENNCVAIVVGLGFSVGTAMLGRKPTEAWSMKVFSFSITYVTVLFGALMVDVLV